MGIKTLYQLASARGVNLWEQHDGLLCTLSTGFKDLDEKIGGIRNDDFVVIGARPGMGMSIFARNLCLNLATCNGNDPGVLFFSAELGRDEIADRMISDMSGVDSWSIRHGLLKDEELKKVDEAIAKFNEVPVYIDDTTHMSMEDFAARVKQAEKDHNLSAVIIDRLDLLLPYDRKSSDYERRIDEVTHGLKDLARGLEVSIILMVSISPYARAEGKSAPSLADLRQYGSLEKDASMILFLHRPDYYEWSNPDASMSNVTEVIARKNLHGAIKKAEIYFHPDKLKFVDMEEDSNRR